MKAFIDRIFKKRKQDAEQVEQPIKTEDKATEAMVKAINKEVKEEVDRIKKPNHFPDCTCFKCYKWKNKDAK